jgi:hypothetical protein
LVVAAGSSLSLANDANALGSMAEVKERIMLSGGVIASMAMSSDTFQQFEAYGTKGDAVFAPNEDLAGAPLSSLTMHAVFCYGWSDNPRSVEDGWWLCKNRCADQLVGDAAAASLLMDAGAHVCVRVCSLSRPSVLS